MKFFLGVILIGFGLLVLTGTYLPVAKEEVKYSLSKYRKNIDLKVVEPVDWEFGIMIPKINANAKVIKNVDPFNETEYQFALSKGVAHAKTSSLPGADKNIFIFSHSSADFYQATRYNSIFYLLSKLETGDDIRLYYGKQPFVYKVTEKKIVDPKDIDFLYSNSDQETLTLMTCWPPGTSLKRLVVTAVKSENFLCPPPPVDYLIRSNCPYGSARLDGECRVVCPMYKNNSYSVACQKDSDCGCSGTDLRSKDLEPQCRCAENKCVYPVSKSVVTNWP